MDRQRHIHTVSALPQYWMTMEKALNIDNVSPFLFAIPFVAIAGWFLFRMTKYGGFKGAMFGASIERTLGEVAGRSTGLLNTVVKVHTLRSSSPDKAVGLELVTKSIASYQVMPLTLSMSEAKKLPSLLESATQIR